MNDELLAIELLVNYNKDNDLHMNFDFSIIQDLNYFVNHFMKAINRNILDVNKSINYKHNYYFHAYKFLLNNIKIVDLNLNIYEKLLSSLTCLNKGYKLLNIIKNNITIYIQENQEYYLNLASHIGTYRTFLFYLNFNKIDNINNFLNLDKTLQEKIFIASFGNSDDRLFKFIINIHELTNISFKKDIILDLIKQISFSNVPSKFMLQRYKLLSKYYKINLSDVLVYCRDFKVISTLHKYYYTEYTFEDIKNIFSNFYNNKLIISFKSLLKTDIENDYYNIWGCIFNINYIFINIEPNNNIIYFSTFKFINNKFVEKTIVNNYQTIIKNMNNNNFYTNEYNFIIKILVNNNLFTKYAMENDIVYDTKVLLYTKFLNLDTHYNTKKYFIINKTLHLLRILLKKKYKINLNNKCNQKLMINYELINYEPQNKHILSQGSIKYQLNLQKYNTIPPRHIFPNEVINTFLLKEKVDGILINNNFNIINDYQVKAEYIEDLDLYLVYDINIPNMSIIERYKYLRNLHPLTKNTELKFIKNYDEFLNIVASEKELIKQMCKENNYTWYPKVACLYDNSKDIIENIIIKNNISQDLYKSDGVILTPVNGFRELKVKPKHLMSIDLLYNNNKWYDKDNNEYNIISEMELINNKIYRCYPNNRELNYISKEINYTAKEFRFDKFEPNSRKIIDTIFHLYKYNWTDFNIYNNYYNFTNNIKKNNPFIEKQNNILIHNINLLKPEFNSSFLDLGCGSGKLIPYIEKYNPKDYLGIDIDVIQLSLALKYHNNNQNIYLFNQCNLSEKWENNWCEIKKYDYIIANFSIMHFYTDDFWESLEKVSKTNTKFLFNVVNDCNYEDSNNYIKHYNDKIIYKFSWIPVIQSEKFINLNEDLKPYLDKYKWEIISNYTPNLDIKLCNCYTWIILNKF